jgi:hypothetical protein
MAERVDYDPGESRAPCGQSGIMASRYAHDAGVQTNGQSWPCGCGWETRSWVDGPDDFSTREVRCDGPRFRVVWGNGSAGTPAGQLDGDFASREEAERAAAEALVRWDNPACGAWVELVAEGPDRAGGRDGDHADR